MSLNVVCNWKQACDGHIGNLWQLIVGLDSVKPAIYGNVRDEIRRQAGSMSIFIWNHLTDG